MAKGSEIIKCSHNRFHEGEFYCNAGHDIDKCNPKECENYWEELIPISDPVNAPKHYVGKIECIDYLWDKLTPEEFTGFCMGNVLKYCSRWRKKDGDFHFKLLPKWIQLYILRWWERQKGGEKMCQKQQP